MNNTMVLMQQPLVDCKAISYEEQTTFVPCKVIWYAFESKDSVTYIVDGCQEILVHLIEGTCYCERFDKDGPVEVQCPGEVIFGIRIQPGYMLDCPNEAIEGIMTVIQMEIEHLSFWDYGLMLQELKDRLLPLIHCRSGHPAYRSVVNEIIESQGRKSVEQMAKDWGYTERHIFNLFREATGSGPKSLTRYIRFQNAIHEMLEDPSLHNSSYIENLNYSDQAHFQREFKNFTGITPRKFLLLFRTEEE